MTNPHTIAGVLEKAADLIEPEGAWYQDGDAKNAYGETVSWDDPSACSWCIGGAVARVLGKEIDFRIKTDAHPIAALLFTVSGTKRFPGPWNDAPERTQAEVVAKLREAAAAARKASQ